MWTQRASGRKSGTLIKFSTPRRRRRRRRRRLPASVLRRRRRIRRRKAGSIALERPPLLSPGRAEPSQASAGHFGTRPKPNGAGPGRQPRDDDDDEVKEEEEEETAEEEEGRDTRLPARSPNRLLRRCAS